MVGGLQGEEWKFIQKCRSQLSGSFRRTPVYCAKWLRNSHSKRLISQLCKNLPSTWSDLLVMAITLSFQLWIVHHLKYWIVDFLSFEITYSMHQLDFRKCSKSGWHDCHQEYASWQILFTSSPCIPDLLMAKDFQALVLHVSELPIALPKIPYNSPQSRIALVIKRLSKHQNLT